MKGFPPLRGAFCEGQTDGYHEKKAVCKGNYPDCAGRRYSDFQDYTGMEEIIVGVVGVLQFDVLKYRLENDIMWKLSWNHCLMSISDG